MTRPTSGKWKKNCKLFPVFSEVRVAQALVYHVVFLDNCLFSSFLFWPMYCLSIDLLFLITSLVSSFFSYFVRYYCRNTFYFYDKF